MKTNLMTAFVAGAALASLLFVSRPGAHAQPKVKTLRGVWEYHCAYVKKDFTDGANKLGADGWELATATYVGVGMTSAATLMCFKRAKAMNTR